MVHPEACVEFIVVEVEGDTVRAAHGCAKEQDCRAALIECVVVFALRSSSSFSDTDDLNLLVFGTSVGRFLARMFGIRLGRIAGVCQTGVGVTVSERASDGQANSESEVDENGGEAHAVVGGGR